MRLDAELRNQIKRCRRARMKRRHPHAGHRARGNAKVNSLEDRRRRLTPDAAFESYLYAVIMPAEVNRGDVGSLVRRCLLMAAVMRARRLSVAAGTRRFARNARERRADDRHGEPNAYQRPDHGSL